MRLVVDTENTGAQRNKAHMFDMRNKCCVIGLRNIDTGESWLYEIEYADNPYGENLAKIQELLDRCTTLIGFNLKYDIHALRRYGLKCSARVFDVQLAYFILTHQRNRYPSLDGVAEHYGLEKKLDVVKEEYWDKGLDTDEVPYAVLCEYLEQDLVVTQDTYLAVTKELEAQSFEMRKLVSVSMQDLVVLEDIEWNGLLFNKEKSIKRGNEIQRQIEDIDTKLKGIFGIPWININSGDHLSAVLYGSTIYIDGKEDYVFTYKDGRTATKQRNTRVPVSPKAMFKPLEGSALAKDGFYSTDEATLKNLGEKARGVQKEVIDTLLLRAKLEKQRSTYFHGFPKKIDEFGWKDNIIHSNFNQCVAGTGRLSSTKPNVQNLEEKIKEMFESRFPCS